MTEFRAIRKAPTKERILNAAEELFAKRGYYGASIREISNRAGVDLGLVNYHFGTKDELFRSAIQRRISDMANEISAELEKSCRDPAGTAAILSSFISWVFSKLKGSDVGWHHYILLISQLIAMRDRPDLLKPMEALDALMVRYVETLHRAFPDASRKNVIWAVHFSQMSVVNVLNGHFGVERVSDGQCSTADYDAMERRLVPFLAAGVEQLLRR